MNVIQTKTEGKTILGIDGKYLTMSEVCAKLGVSEGRVRQFIKGGRISKYEKFGRSYAFEAEEIDQLSKQDRKSGRPAKEDKKEKGN